MKYYYLDEDTTPVGPIAGKDIVRFLSEGTISLDTLAAREGSEEWVKLQKLLPNIAKDNSRLPPVPICAHTNKDEVITNLESEVKPILHTPPTSSISTVWLWSLFGLFFITNTLFFIVILIQDSGYYHTKGITSNIISIHYVAWISSCIYWMILHYMSWNRLPSAHLFTSPRKAVFLLLIPIYNIYWMFLSFSKLDEGYTSWSQEQGVSRLKTRFYCSTIPAIWLVSFALMLDSTMKLTVSDEYIYVYSLINITVNIVSTFLLFELYRRIVPLANLLCVKSKV